MKVRNKECERRTLWPCIGDLFLGCQSSHIQLRKNGEEGDTGGHRERTQKERERGRGRQHLLRAISLRLLNAGKASNLKVEGGGDHWELGSWGGGEGKLGEKGNHDKSAKGLIKDGESGKKEKGSLKGKLSWGRGGCGGRVICAICLSRQCVP